MGATSLGGSNGSDWLFAEGHTGTGFQQYLVLANFTTSSAQALIKLEYTNGTVQNVPVTVNAQSQLYFDVNNAYSHPVSGCGCTPTGDVSAEVTSSTASIVAERMMYFKYGTIPGITDVVGEAGPSSHAVYSFSEGYTGGTFNEWLTLQNPNNKSEVVAVTFFADKTVISKEITLPATSRTTINVNSIIVPIATAYPVNVNGSDGFAVSMTVQAFSGTIIVERPLYFKYNGIPGGNDVIGYTGN
ncbi:hypothetical protein [Ktedonobacter racemifer]|uniref:Uncharacterized protein n=1 Tax=Ktedonobacter racemifer DSM 44963 TaxID=485913 RepID=D6TGE0_KTERA|nr:hypothetical protein [Ktedonobacter racemifer]EFH90652.1 hypothetical protein Krac_12279 [Ktedonobacter racemifer DSM 44963]